MAIIGMIIGAIYKCNNLGQCSVILTKMGHCTYQHDTYFVRVLYLESLLKEATIFLRKIKPAGIVFSNIPANTSSVEKNP